MQANPEKFQVMFMKSINSPEEFPDCLTVDNIVIERQHSVKLLGITIDEKLKFDEHVEIICKKASRQLNVLYRFKKIFSEKEKSTMYRTFVLANFNYCPIVWSFCGVMHMRKMEKIQERALRFLLNDFTSSYSELLTKAGYESLHLRRMKTIACEVFKSLNSLNPSFMGDMFKMKENVYDLRDNHRLVQPVFKKLTYGRNTFGYYGAHLWNKLPSDLMNNAGDLNTFKSLLSSWEGPKCTCAMCSFM